MARKLFIAALFVAFSATLVVGEAEAVVVERVVAVVGEKAILLTDLRKRARPFLLQLYQRVPPGAQRAAAESRVLSDLIQRMVDEELESKVASRDNMRVTAEEVDKAMRNIARASNMPLPQMLENVKRDTGMTEVEYRQEIRRQVLEGKLLNRMVQNQRVTEKELRDMFDRVQLQERRILLYNPAWIVFRVGEKPSKRVLEQKMKLAREVVKRARAGEDFADLAAEYSEDAPTRDKGGDLSIRAPSRSQHAMTGKYRQIDKPLEQRALELDPGEVSEPFRYKEGIVVLHLISRQPSNYTAFEASRPEMFERVRNEKMQKVKEKWLRDLRRRNHVDIRL